jgi:hypothetical protein
VDGGSCRDGPSERAAARVECEGPVQPSHEPRGRGSVLGWQAVVTRRMTVVIGVGLLVVVGVLIAIAIAIFNDR